MEGAKDTFYVSKFFAFCIVVGLVVGAFVNGEKIMDLLGGNEWKVTGGNQRFEVVYEQKKGSEKVQVLKDNETGVHYLYVKEGNVSSLTPLKKDLKTEVGDALKSVMGLK